MRELADAQRIWTFLHFIPEVPGWEDRSLFLEQLAPLAVYDYDPYSQVLSKLERGHAKDLRDGESMVEEGLVERGRLLELFERIEPDLYRFPSIDPSSFRRAVQRFVEEG